MSIRTGRTRFQDHFRVDHPVARPCAGERGPAASGIEPEYRGSTVLVAGAARTGMAATEFLLSRGARVILTDLKGPGELASALAPLREMSRQAGELILELGGHNPETLSQCDLIVLSPGIPASLPFLEEAGRRGIPIIAEVELAWRHLKGTLLAITGSNGKTTTTVLVSEILRASGVNAHAAGNVGVPLTSFVRQSQPGDVYVAELSSFQLETIDRLRPKVAALLNLTPDHLDRYARFEDYAAAKCRIFRNQSAADLAVLNADEERVASLAGGLRAAPAFFSRRIEPARGAFLRGQHLVHRDAQGDQAILDRSEIRMRGGHNLENALASCAIALPAGATAEGAASVLRSFQGVEHRLEQVAEIGGVQYFNDSKATNVDATVKSLDAFAGDVLLIAGGRDKGGDFTSLRSLVAQKVRHLVLIGEAAPRIREALQGATDISEAASLPQAVAACRRMARPGDVVLLAPACASFDMFQNYEERGRVFKAAVLSLEPPE